MRRWMALIAVAAVAVAVFAPAQAADPDVPGSGTGCGSTEPLTPLVVGTVGEPGDSDDWYDASFASGTQTIELRSVFVPYVGGAQGTPSGVRLRVHLWDKSTNTCSFAIAYVFCDTVFSEFDDPGPCQPHNYPSSGGAATYTFPGPGDYQVQVDADSDVPASYIIREL